MKLIGKYLKPFAALVLVCLVLLFGQAMADLSLPNLMSDIVNVGVQQNGVEEGAPEAMSLNAMNLLKTMMDTSGQTLMDKCYFTYDKSSSEAQRYEDKYPLLREESVCVLNRSIDNPETLEELDAVYSRASYAFMLYMQSAAESGELEDAMKIAMQGQAGMPSGEALPPSAMPEGAEGAFPEGESSLPQGYAGDIPEGAIVAEPRGSAAAMAAGKEELTIRNLTADGPEGYVVSGGEGQPETSQPGAVFPEDETSLPSEPEGEVSPPAQGEDGSAAGEGAFDFSAEGGYDNINPQDIYELIPILQLVPRESLNAAWEQAGESGSSMMAAQVGVTFKRLFYEELGVSLEEIQSAYIWQKGGQMLLVALLGVLAAVCVGFLSSRIAGKIAMRLRRDLFAKVESFSGAEFNQFSTASLITRTTNDVQQVQMLVTMGLRMMCYAPIMGVGGVIFAVGKSVSMSWIIAAAVVVMLGVIIVALAVAMPKFASLQKLIDKVNLVSRENLSGMMVVRAFGNEKYEEERFGKANDELTNTTAFVQKVMAGMMPAMMLIMNVTSLVIIWVGGHAIEASTLQIGDMMAFIQYAMQIIMSFLFIAMTFIMVPRAKVSAVRIAQVLDTPLEITDAPDAKALPRIKGEIEFKDVSFRYGGAEENVLEHISFTAKPGETTAFIGSTGSGKSTLVNLIPRFYDVTQGEILLDGVDIRKIPQEQLRENIGYVPQKGFLFSGTIASNLEYGKEDASAEEISHALEVAQASSFVGEMEEGAQSAVSQGGTNVSGGQRQRLSIARALIKQACIYIFDDSFSALDFKTDSQLRRALKEDTENATVLIVAQRVSTIMNAQQILVLDDGKVVGKGTHQELLQSCPEYREIAESQMQKEELA